MFRRMVAIPYEQYAQMNMSHSLQHVHEPYNVQLTNLDKQYEERERITDPYRRMILQSETLEEMKALKERMRSLIASNSPKPYRNRSSALFDDIEPDLKFNERGEIMNEKGKVVPHSNVQDLIQYAVRDRRREVVPTGWNEFLSFMKSRNVPRHMLNRFTIDEMDGNSVGAQTFVFGTPAARHADVSGTVVKRTTPVTTNVKNTRKRGETERNPFDQIKENIAHFSPPTPKKRRKLSQRTRKAPLRYGFLDKF